MDDGLLDRDLAFRITSLPSLAAIPNIASGRIGSDQVPRLLAVAGWASTWPASGWALA